MRHKGGLRHVRAPSSRQGEGAGRCGRGGHARGTKGRPYRARGPAGAASAGLTTDARLLYERTGLTTGAPFAAVQPLTRLV